VPGKNKPHRVVGCRLHCLWRALRAFPQKRLDEAAGAAAFAGFLALFPFLILLVSLAGILGTTTQAEVLIARAAAYLPPDAAGAVAAIVRDVTRLHDPGDILTLAVIGTVWVASSGVEGLRSGLNAAFEVTEPRPFWLRRLQSMLFVMLLAVGLIVLSLLIIAAPLWLVWLRQHMPMADGVWARLNVGRFVVVFVFLMTLVSMLYQWLPNARLSWRETLPGAMLAAGLWLLFAWGFARYVANFGQYNVTYGSLGGVIVLLVFLNISAAVLLYGAEVNQQRLRLQSPAAPAHRPARSRRGRYGPAPNAR
jgi:membrane protein